MADIKLGRLVAQVTLDNALFLKGLRKTESRLRMMANRVKEIGRDLTFGMSVPLAIIGKAAFENFSKMEEGLIKVQKTTGATTKEMKVFKEEIQDLSTVIPVSSEALLDIAKALGQTGQKVGDDLIGTVQLVARFANSTNVSAQEAATALSIMRRQMGLARDQTQKLASAIVFLGNETEATEADVIAYSKRISATGTLSGFVAADILAIASTMFSVGIAAEKGGTALNKLWIRIEKGVSSINDDLRNFAKIADMTAKDFRKAWVEDTGMAWVALLSGLRDSANTLELVGFLVDDLRTTETLLLLASDAKTMGQRMKEARIEFERGTAVMEESELAFSTLGSQIKTMTALLAVIGERVFASFEKALRGMISDVKKFLRRVEKPLVKFFKDLTEEQKKNIVQWTILGVVLPPVAFALASIASAMSGLLIPFALAGSMISKLFPKSFGKGIARTARYAGVLAKGFSFLARMAAGAVGVLLVLASTYKQLRAEFSASESFSIIARGIMKGVRYILAGVDLVLESIFAVVTIALTELLVAAFLLINDFLLLLLSPLKDVAFIGGWVTAWENAMDSVAKKAKKFQEAVFKEPLRQFRETLAEIGSTSIGPPVYISRRQFEDAERGEREEEKLAAADKRMKKYAKTMKILGNIGGDVSEWITDINREIATLNVNPMTLKFAALKSELEQLFTTEFKEEWRDSTFLSEMFEKALDKLRFSLERLSGAQADKLFEDTAKSLERQVMVYRTLDPVQKIVLENTLAYVDAQEALGTDLEVVNQQLDVLVPKWRAFAQEQDAVNFAQEKFDKSFFGILEKQVEGAATSGQILSDSIFSIVDGFAAAAVSGESFGETMKNVFLSMLRDIAKLIIKLLIVKALQAALGGLSSAGPPSGTAGLQSPPSAGSFGSMFGELSPPSLGDFSPTTYSLAHGGITSGPSIASVGDNRSGTEAIIPLERFDEIFGGMRGEIIINVDSPDAPVNIEEMLDARDRRVISVSIESSLAKVQQDFVQGGPTSVSAETAFGLNRFTGRGTR